MEQSDEVKQLLIEIRDLQKKHYEEWQAAYKRGIQDQEHAMLQIEKIRKKAKRAAVVTTALFIGFLLLIVAPFLWPLASTRLTTSRASIEDLVRMYQQGAGYDDVAGEQFKRMGDKAKRELIRLSDAPNTRRDIAETAHQILTIYFPGEDSRAAIQRYIDRIADPVEKKTYQDLWNALWKTTKHEPPH